MKNWQTLLLKQRILQYFRTKTPTGLLYWNFNLEVGMNLTDTDEQ